MDSLKGSKAASEGNAPPAASLCEMNQVIYYKPAPGCVGVHRGLLPGGLNWKMRCENVAGLSFYG